ncbi:MAG: hypothetical protein HUJ61_03835 [Bacilli bacterium]|nr:hypothetical protein [Bacilli bacterium]
MKKSKLLTLSAALLLAGSLASCGGETAKGIEVDFGVGYSTSFDGTTFTATVVSAAFEKGTEKVVDARLDALQIKLNKVTVSVGEGEGSTTEDRVGIVSGSGAKSKCELGTDYGMKQYGGNYEYYEQAESLTDYAAGKTVTEIVAINTKGDPAPVAGVSIANADFNVALKNALVNKAAIEGKFAKVYAGVGFGVASATEKTSKGTSTYSHTELGLDFAGAITDGEKVIASFCDTFAAEMIISPADATKFAPVSTSKYLELEVEGNVLKSKRTLGADYGMGDDGLGYTKNCSNLDTYVAGKTIAEVKALTANEQGKVPTASVSVSQGAGLLQATQEAADYSTKQYFTDKLVSAK